MTANLRTKETTTDPVHGRVAQEHAALRARWLGALTVQQRGDLLSAFPVCDAGLIATGQYLLIQMKRPRTKTASGLIHTVTQTQEHERWNEQIGLVLSMGPLAYRKRQDPTQWWPEGPWCVAGDYVRIPKFGFDRFEVPLAGDIAESIVFATIEDKNVLGVVTCNPLTVKSYI